MEGWINNFRYTAQPEGTFFLYGYMLIGHLFVILAICPGIGKFIYIFVGLFIWTEHINRH